MSAEEDFKAEVHRRIDRIAELLNQDGIERDGPTCMAMLNHVIEALADSGMPREAFLETCGAMFDWYAEQQGPADRGD